MDFAQPVYIGYSFIALVIIVGVLYALDSRVYDKKGRRVPGPNSNAFPPNFSSVVLTARNEKRASDAVRVTMINKLGNGQLCGFSVFGVKIVMVGHPDLVRTILTGKHDKFPKPPLYDRVKFILGDGLGTSHGTKWQGHRHLINPGFHAEQLRGMMSIFNHHTNIMLSQWASPQTVTKRDLNKDLTDLAMAVICHSAFGYKFKAHPEDDQLFDHANVMADELNERILDPFDWWPMLFPLRRRRVGNTCNFINNLVDTAVTDRLQAHADQAMLVKNPDHAGHETPKDLLDILLHARHGDESSMSSKNIRDHAITFIAAGHETTSSTLLWTFYELTRHPDIMALVIEEVDLICKDIKPNAQGEIFINSDEWVKFAYMAQVFKEILRLHPPLPIVARSNAEPVTLGEFEMPAHCRLVLCVPAVHRHPDFWDHPDDFIPDRFSAENSRTTLKHPFQYIPFSAGPRNCIGQRFAMMEATVILAQILRRYLPHMDPVDANMVKFEETLTQQPKKLRVTFTKRL